MPPLLLLLLLSAPPVHASTEAVNFQRHIWIWETETFRMLDDVGYQNEIATFLKGEKISTVYLYADEYQGRNILTNEPQKYRKLIENYHSRGIKVYALLGSYYLKTWEYILPQKRVLALRMFGNVLKFNSSCDSASHFERFDGVNADIEPYMLDDWRAKQNLRVSQYLDLSAAFMRMKKDAGSQIPVGPAMPFWFDGIENVKWNGAIRKLNEHVQTIYDYVAIMDYRNFAEGSDGMISHATDELNFADSTGRKVMIGVETLKSEPAKITFYGKSYATMQAQLKLAETAFAQHPSFGGFVIHHLKTFRTMAEESK